MDKVIISLVGAKRSGKTTAGLIIEEMIQNPTYVTAIADKLKVELSVAYDIDLIHFNSQDLKEERFIYPIRTKVDTISHLLESFKLGTKDIKVSSSLLLELATKEMFTPRELMQEMGSFIREVFGKKIHLHHLNLENEITIISDVRYKAEFDYLESLEKKGYYHIPLYIHNAKSENSGDNHSSEKDISKFKKKCIFIDNNAKDIDDLANQLEYVLMEYLG